MQTYRKVGLGDLTDILSSIGTDVQNVVQGQAQYNLASGLESQLPTLAAIVAGALVLIAFTKRK